MDGRKIMMPRRQAIRVNYYQGRSLIQCSLLCLKFDSWFTVHIRVDEELRWEVTRQVGMEWRLEFESSDYRFGEVVPADDLCRCSCCVCGGGSL